MNKLNLLTGALVVATALPSFASSLKIKSTASNKNKIRISINADSDLKVGDIVGTNEKCRYEITQLRNSSAIATVESCENKASVKKSARIKVLDFASDNTTAASKRSSLSNSTRVSAASVQPKIQSRAFKSADGTVSRAIGLSYSLNNSIAGSISGKKVSYQTNNPISLNSTFGRIKDNGFGYVSSFSFAFDGRLQEQKIADTTNKLQGATFTQMQATWNMAYEFSPNNIILGGINYPFMFENTNVNFSGQLGYQVSYNRVLNNDFVLDLTYEVVKYEVNNTTTFNNDGIALRVSYFY